MNTDEKRKIGPCAILATITVGLVVIFELVYMVMASLPEGALFSRFSPKLSAEDMAMLQANIPGLQSSKELAKEKVPATNAVTAVDAALEARDRSVTNDVPSVITDVDGVPSSIRGADNVQWTVVDTNEFQKMIAATNALLQAASATNGLEETLAPTNEPPHTLEPATQTEPAGIETTEKEIVPVG